MANSRLEKIGTIYSRSRSLIQSGALHYNDRPLWYDIYEAFPPMEEPRFDRPIPNMQMKQIFYEEDQVRGQLHQSLGRVGTVHLLNQQTPSFTQKFIKMFKKLEVQYEVGQRTTDQLFTEALDMLKNEREAQVKAESNDDIVDGELTSAFKKALLEQQKATDTNTGGVKIKDLFKD